MSRLHVFLFKKEGEILPQKLVEAVTEKYPTGCGAIMHDADGIDMVSEPKKGTWKWVNHVQNTYKDSPIIFSFSNLPKNSLPEDIPPFELLADKDDNTILAGVLDGDFSNHTRAAGTNSPAYMAAKSLIDPLLDLYIDVNEDAGALLEQLKSPVFKRQMRTLGIGKENVVFLMHNSGDILDYSSNEVKLNHFDFGWATDACGYDHKAELEPASDVKPDTGKKSKLLILDDDEEIILDKKDEEIVTKEEDATLVLEDEIKMGHPSSDCKTKGQKREWYQDWNAITNPMTQLGEVPEGYANKSIDVPILDEPRSVTKAKSRAEKKTEVVVKSLQELGEQLQEPSYIIKGESKDYNHKMLQKDGILGKMLDANQKEITDPKKIQGEERKKPSFMEQCGFGAEGLSKLAQLPLEGFYHIGKNDLNSLAVLAMNLNSALVAERQKNAVPAETKTARVSKLAS